VFFAAREEISLRDGSKEELAEFCRQRDGFDEEKAADQLTAPYGLRYSPLYQKRRQGKTRHADDKTGK
jgi:transposase